MVNSSIYYHGLTGRTIRLLTVEPGDPETPLQCKLSELCLDTALISYHALSYCWGANHSPVEITCNSQPLLVTPNLYSFLLEYRRRGTNIPLWVDAICIDQSNIAERTSQVRMMDQIYSKADCVVVWLGEAEETDKLALELLKEILVPWANSKDIPILETGQEALAYDAYLSPRVSQEHFNALAAFLSRPWFSRIWIVQELLLARRVTIWCGWRTVDEQVSILEATARLSQMITCCYKLNEAAIGIVGKDEKAQREAKMKLSCAHVLFMIKYARQNAMSGTLYLMLMTRWFDATDQRDKIFALVGLTSDIDKTFVDYSKSYQDVINDLSCMLLDGRIVPMMGCVLDIWSFITREEEDDITEPSWVVDLVKVMSSAYTPMSSAYPTDNSVIGRTSEVQFPETDGQKSLRIRGTVFDTIVHVIPFPATSQNAPQSKLELYQNVSAYLDWLQRVRDLIAPMGDLTIPPIGCSGDLVYENTGEFLYDALWRTLCCNRSAMDAFEPPADSSGYAAWLGNFQVHQWRHGTRKMEWLLLGIATVSFSALTYRFRKNRLLLFAIPLAFPSLVRFCSRIWNKFWEGYQTQLQIMQRDFEAMVGQWSKGRQFGLTGLGMIGLLPVSAKVGDSVGLFAGCRVPFVLRKSEAGYRIVGDAYLHGVMNGEGDESEGEMLRIV